MVRVISQETFDEVVLEGVNEFDNTLEEAIDNATKEFEAQGVNLSNIVKNMHINEDKELVHDILAALKDIDEFNNGNHGIPIIQALKNFNNECRLSLAHKILANENKAYFKLLEILKAIQADSHILENTLLTMVSLTEGNPDVLTEEGISVMMNFLGDGSEIVLPEYVIKWCLECSLKHEKNRQDLIAAGAVVKIVSILSTHKHDEKVVKIACKALRAFTLDDDVRTEFGKAHDHARLLVEEHNMINLCLELIKEWLMENDVVSEILSTLSKLCVRTEYCQEAVDHGALTIINDVLSSSKNAVLLKQAISLLRTVSGNDKVKHDAMKSGVSQLIISAMNLHQNNSGVCEAGCGAISMLSLRVPSHAATIVSEGGGDAIIQAMKLHPKDEQIQKLGCLAIRNMAARVPQNQAALLSCGAEEIINAAIANHSECVGDLAKSALRDLGLPVQLQEQWRGTGHEIER